jgi:hypothetical protein
MSNMSSPSFESHPKIVQMLKRDNCCLAPMIFVPAGRGVLERCMNVTATWLRTSTPYLQVAECLHTFERDVKPLPNFVLTPSTLSTLSLLEAALSRSHGSLLLLGQCGSGRRDLLSLTCHSLQLIPRTPAAVPNFGARHFKAFIRDAMHTAGVDGAPTVVVLEDHHLACGAVLGMVNSLLVGGEVPGLHKHDELEKELEALRNVLEGSSDAPSGGRLAAVFAQRVHQV